MKDEAIQPLSPGERQVEVAFTSCQRPNNSATASATCVITTMKVTRGARYSRRVRSDKHSDERQRNRRETHESRREDRSEELLGWAAEVVEEARERAACQGPGARHGENQVDAGRRDGR